jgi:N6-adenosine-specific RNA methylase IME4
MSRSIAAQLEELRAKRRKYGAILADVPWRFQHWDRNVKAIRTRATDKLRYRTLTSGFIEELPIADLAADNCVLFLWVPWPHLQHGLRLIESWSFTYKTCAFDWMKTTKPLGCEIKLAFGMGFWTRANTEVCLLATRGKPKRWSAAVPMAILEPRREHSQKPDCVHDRIKALVRGPYLELFGRREVNGWTVTGDQVRKFK